MEKPVKFTNEKKLFSLKGVIDVGKQAVIEVLDIGYSTKTFDIANQALILEEGHYPASDKQTFFDVSISDVMDCVQIIAREWSYGDCLTTKVSAGTCEDAGPYLSAEQSKGDGIGVDDLPRKFSGDRDTDTLGIDEVHRIVKITRRLQQSSRHSNE